MISKFQNGLGSLLRWGLSEPDFYGDLVYRLKRIVGSDGFSARFVKIISHRGKIGYDIDVLRRAACLVVDPVAVGGFAFLFGCAPVGRASDSVVVPTWGLVCWWGGGGLVLWLCVGPTGVYLLDFFCSGIQFNLLLSPCPCFISLLCLGLYVLGDGALVGWGSFVRAGCLYVLIHFWVGGGVGAVGPVWALG